MKRIALIALASSALMTQAFAADMALRGSILKAPPLVEAAFSWTGFYIGANVGAGWGTNTADLNSIAIGAPANVVLPLGLPLGQVGQNGFLAGGQVGVNYQFGDFVVGIEGEGDWTDIRGHSSCLAVLTCSAKHRWLADVAARAGLTFGRTLVYLKGGVAWTKLDTDTTLSLAGVTLAAPVSTTRQGFLLGTGVEHAIGHGWSAKVEYDYMDFGSKTQDVAVNLAVANARAIPGITANTTNEQRDHVVKFGVNYRFGQ